MNTHSELSRPVKPGSGPSPLQLTLPLGLDSLARALRIGMKTSSVSLKRLLPPTSQY